MNPRLADLAVFAVLAGIALGLTASCVVHALAR